MVYQVEDVEVRLGNARRALQTDQDAQEAVQKAMADDKDDIARQGAALVDMGQQVLPAQSTVAYLPIRMLHWSLKPVSFGFACCVLQDMCWLRCSAAC